jgi:hypothetical protein
MPIRVVEYFCYQMAVAVAANLIALLLLFVPAVVLDCRRTLAAVAAGGAGAGRCCLRVSGAAGGAPDGSAPGGSALFGSAQGGSGGGAIARFASDVYAPLLLSPAAAVPVLVGFGALCGALAWQGFARTETGLAVSDFTSVGSYQRDFALVLEREYALPLLLTKLDCFQVGPRAFVHLCPRLTTNVALDAGTPCTRRTFSQKHAPCRPPRRSRWGPEKMESNSCKTLLPLHPVCVKQ